MREERRKEYGCNHWAIELKSTELDLNASRKEIKCIKCDRLVGSWHIPNKKIMPLKRKWSRKERLVMR